MEDWPRQIDLIVSGHALRQMFVRQISMEEVQSVLKIGEVIGDYPDDSPFPSRLFFAWVNNHPLHVVLAYDRIGRKGVVVTTYRPDSTIWNADFRSRRKP